MFLDDDISFNNSSFKNMEKFIKKMITSDILLIFLKRYNLVFTTI